MTHNPFHNPNPPSYATLASIVTAIFVALLALCHMF